MRRDGMESTTGDRTEKTLTRTVEDLYGRPVEYELPVTSFPTSSGSSS